MTWPDISNMSQCPERSISQNAIGIWHLTKVFISDWRTPYATSLLGQNLFDGLQALSVVHQLELPGSVLTAWTLLSSVVLSSAWLHPLAEFNLAAGTCFLLAAVLGLAAASELPLPSWGTVSADLVLPKNRISMSCEAEFTAANHRCPLRFFLYECAFCSHSKQETSNILLKGLELFLFLLWFEGLM